MKVVFEANARGEIKAALSQDKYKNYCDPTPFAQINICAVKHTALSLLWVFRVFWFGILGLVI
jgi:hypothetical protein